jgi:hypothetical protein
MASLILSLAAAGDRAGGGVRVVGCSGAHPLDDLAERFGDDEGVLDGRARVVVDVSGRGEHMPDPA